MNILGVTKVSLIGLYVFSILVSGYVLSSLSLRSQELHAGKLAEKLVFPLLIGDRNLAIENVEESVKNSDIQMISVKNSLGESVVMRGGPSYMPNVVRYEITDSGIDGKLESLGLLEVEYSRRLENYLYLILILTSVFLLVIELMKIEKRHDVNRHDKFVGEAVASLKFLSNGDYKENTGLGDLYLSKNDSTLPAAIRELSFTLRKNEQNNREKSRHIAMMSHEIRNPLNSLVLAIHAAREGDPDQLRENLETASDACDHLSSVVDDAIDISKIESGSLDIVNEPFSLYELTNSVMSSIDAEVGVDVKVDRSNCHPFYMGDLRRIKQILMNLLVNSSKNTAKGYIELSITECNRGEILKFVVKDTGAGIPAEKLLNVFEPFVSDNNGSGLGLYICKKLVEAMQGEIFCESKVGFGTQTTVALPIVSVSDEEYFKVSGHCEDIDSRDDILKDCRVLIVEDNEQSRKALVNVVTSWGMECVSVANGVEALGLDVNGFNIMLVDIQMPVMDGFELVRSLREYGVSEPIIAITGNVLLGESKRAKEAGFTGFVGKPVVPGKLQKLVRELLGDEGNFGVAKIDASMLKTYPGLCLQDARERFGLDDALLMGDMNNFVTRYGDIEEVLKLDIKEVENKQILVRVGHDLKTDAAQIGASEISAIAMLMDDDEVSEEQLEFCVSLLNRKLPALINTIKEAAGDIRSRSV